MARETLDQVRKKAQKEVKEIKKSVWLKCAECQGFFVDGYQACPNKDCPVRSFYPPQRTIESAAFKNEMASLAKKHKNDEEFVDKILPPLKSKKSALTKTRKLKKIIKHQKPAAKTLAKKGKK